MSVKRYDLDGNADGYFDDPFMKVREKGKFVLHSDYAELEARHNALKARTRSINVWSECDKCEYLFIPSGKGSETKCGTCLRTRHNELWKNVIQLEGDYEAMRDIAVTEAVRCDKKREALEKAEARHKALRDAIANTLIIYDRMVPSLKDHIAARAEVDRLLEEAL